jgi:hypothetical protein
LNRSVRGSSVDRVDELHRYLVELQRPSLGWPELDAIAAGARQAAGELTRLGRPVRFLRSVYVPEDGSCLLVYEARSASDVRSAAESVGVGVERVAEALHTAAAADDP